MKFIDMRFNETIVKGWVGKTFEKYRCDAFDFTNSVTQIVGIYINGEVFSLRNIQKNVDYFGHTEDIAIFEVSKTEDSSIKSAFQDTDMIGTPVNGIITKILLVNENQRISDHKKILYDVWLTRGVIFYVDNREISFEKDMVPFSEEIIIRRGYDLMDKLSDEKTFLEGWNDSEIPECRREIVEITSDS